MTKFGLRSQANLAMRLVTTGLRCVSPNMTNENAD